MGFEQAGFRVVWANEFNPHCRDTYIRNHPNTEFVLGDICKIDPNTIPDCDGFIGGPPCQDYSTAGHMNENGGRAALTVSFAKIVEHIRPKYFLMENVAVIEKSKTLKVVNKIFRDAGYGLTQLVLDASKCGVPQKRMRFITFGVLDGKDGDAEEIFKSGQSEKLMTMRDYFGDSLGFQHYFRVPTNYSRRGIYSIDEPAMTIRGVDRPVPKGYKGHPADSAPLTPDIRTLTYQERSWIQTFPKDFIWEGTKTNLNQIIGNAVPVKLAEYIANCIKKYIEENEGC